MISQQDIHYLIEDRNRLRREVTSLHRRIKEWTADGKDTLPLRTSIRSINEKLGRLNQQINERANPHWASEDRKRQICFTVTQLNARLLSSKAVDEDQIEAQIFELIQELDQIDPNWEDHPIDRPSPREKRMIGNRQNPVRRKTFGGGPPPVVTRRPTKDRT